MELEFLDKCTIVDLENQIVDEETGDTTNVIICENQRCDYQPSHTRNINSTLVADSPKLFLPYDFPYSQLLNRNLTVIISRLRKVGVTEIVEIDSETGEERTTEIYSMFKMRDENGKELEGEYKVNTMYTSSAIDIDFKEDYKGGNPSKKQLVIAKIEDWWEVCVNDPYLDGIQVELREVTYL